MPRPELTGESKLPFNPIPSTSIQAHSSGLVSAEKGEGDLIENESTRSRSEAETESSGDETVTETVTEKGSAFPRPDSDGQSVGRSELLRAGGAGEGGAEAKTEAEAEAGKEDAEEGETASEEGLLKQRTRRKEAKSKLPRDTYEDGNNENEEEGGGDGARGSARERGKGVAGGRGADGEDSEEGESEERESEEEGKRRAADKKRRTEGFDYDDGVEHKGGEDDDDGREERRREEGINEEGVGTEETNKEGSKEERKGGSREGFDYDDGVGDGSGDGGEGKGSKRNGDDDDDGDGDGGELEERTKEEGQKRMKRSPVRYDEEEEGEEGGGEEGVESGGGKAKGMLKGGESDVGAREEEEEEEEKGKSLESAQQPSNKRKGVESDPGADDEEDEEEEEGKRQGVKKGTEKGASGEENEEEGQEKAREREEEEEEEEGDEEGEGEAPTKARKRQEGEEEREEEGGAPALVPVYETMHGREVVWQVPRGDLPLAGVVFFAHGCTHRATHFWPPHRACPSCLGLPEDMALVQHALKRRLAVIAVSSLSTCWDTSFPPERSLDIPPVVQVLTTWRQQHHLRTLPLFALGASSGGYFISLLAHSIDLQALAIIISSGVKKAFDSPLPSGRQFPPTLFVHMPKDEQRAEAVERAVEILRSKGSEAGQIPCLEKRLGPSFLSDRIPNLTLAASERIFQALKQGGVVGEDGRMVRDGRRSGWIAVLQKEGVMEELERGSKYSRAGEGTGGEGGGEGDEEEEGAGGGEESGESGGGEGGGGEGGGSEAMEGAIEEELNVAFAFHEMTSEHGHSMMDWLLGKCGGSSSSSSGSSTSSRSRSSSSSSGGRGSKGGSDGEGDSNRRRLRGAVGGGGGEDDEEEGADHGGEGAATGRPGVQATGTSRSGRCVYN
ncbi:unnamed protein product [Closterium sp. NIES-54]